MNSTDIYEAALRPRRRYGPTLIALLVCAAVAWLGWCGVLVIRAQRDAVIGKACADAGYDWAGGDCKAPDIELHLAPPQAHETPPEPTTPRAPWSSPLGPGGL